MQIIERFKRIELVKDAEGFLGVRFAGDRGCGNSLSMAANEAELYHTGKGFECPLSIQEHAKVDEWFDRFEGI